MKLREVLIAVHVTRYSHEICSGDAGTETPETLKTVIRHPVRKGR